MPALHELQRRFAAVLAGQVDAGALAGDIEAGRVPPGRRLAVHRNTVRGGLCQALRLRHPAVARWVGEDFFDQAVLAHAAGDWPRAPQLGAWGAGFPDFLGRYPPAAPLPWLADLARFEGLLDALAARGDDGPAERWPAIVLGDGVELALAPSLRVFSTRHPVDELREAAMEEDCVLPAGFDRPGLLHLVAWRDGAALKSRRVGAVAAAFLGRLHAATPAAALQAALAAAGVAAAEALEALQRDVFAAPFAALRPVANPLPSDHHEGTPPCNA
jgi:hypothetical protein